MHQSATVTYGGLYDSLSVPQVRAAIDVLLSRRISLAAFEPEQHACVGNGAALAPRRATGEVVLTYCPVDGQERSRAFTVEDRESIVSTYAAVFRSARWQVEEDTEIGRDGREWLARLIMKPPRLSGDLARELNAAAVLESSPMHPAIVVGGVATHAYLDVSDGRFVVSVHTDTGDVPDGLTLRITVNGEIVFDED